MEASSIIWFLSGIFSPFWTSPDNMKSYLGSAKTNSSDSIVEWRTTIGSFKSDRNKHRPPALLRLRAGIKNDVIKIEMNVFQATSTKSRYLCYLFQEVAKKKVCNLFFLGFCFQNINIFGVRIKRCFPFLNMSGEKMKMQPHKIKLILRPFIGAVRSSTCLGRRNDSRSTIEIRGESSAW